jgi:hypothetical protein
VTFSSAHRTDHYGHNISLSCSLSPGSFPRQSNGCRSNHCPQRVEGLWSALPRRPAIAIAAAEFSTLALTMPPTVPGGGGGEESTSLAALPVNSVFGWGHGNHSVMRVVFPSTAAGGGSIPRRTSINPTAIACAKYHSVAITVDGAVYTWGLQRDSLGIAAAAVSSAKRADTEWATASDGRRIRSKSIGGLGCNISTGSSAISSPRLVVGLLPENGGGKAVAVSASETHTAVVTADGHLFTWGASVDKDVLGHKGVKWLQVPRKVKRVHRAVGVAAAKEHTVLLMATSFPPLPAAASMCRNKVKPLTLQECAAIEISRNVDMFNVLPIATIARRLTCLPLMSFCDEFIHKNLDGVLAMGNKNDFTAFMSSSWLGFAGKGQINFEPDGPFHPFFYHFVNSNVGDHCVMLEKYACSFVPQRKKVKMRLLGEEQRPTASACDEQDVPKTDECEHKCVTLAASTDDGSAGLSSHEKTNNDQSQLSTKLFTEEPMAKFKSTSIPDSAPKFRCEVCNVLCPDCDSYSLHMNGRRHRNRLAHLKVNEEKLVAETMMEKKRMQLIEMSAGRNDFAASADRMMKTSDGPSVGNTTTTAWASNAMSPLKPSGMNVIPKSFQDILTEEQQRSSKVTAQTNGIISSPVVSDHSTVARTPTTVLHHGQTTVGRGILTSSPVTGLPMPSLPLSAFVKKGGTQKVVESAGKARSGGAAGWGAKADCSPRPRGAAKSFTAIQEEEEYIRNNEDRMSRIEGNQWFIPQRERAASIGEIQERERKDREMQDLIEEQRRIEKDIVDRARREKTDIHIKKYKRRPHKKPVKNNS